jgi:hypothetical protein
MKLDDEKIDVTYAAAKADLDRLIAACKAIDDEQWLLDPQCQEHSDLIVKWRAAYQHFIKQ